MWGWPAQCDPRQINHARVAAMQESQRMARAEQDEWFDAERLPIFEKATFGLDEDYHLMVETTQVLDLEDGGAVAKLPWANMEGGGSADNAVLIINDLGAFL